MIRTANRPRRPTRPPKPLTTHAARTGAARSGREQRKSRRLGVVMVLSAATMVMVMGFLAFTIDVGFITLTKGQMKGYTDASSMAASQELMPAFQLGSTIDAATVQTNAGIVAEEVAALHRSGDHTSAYIERGRDVRFGQYYKDPVSHEWVKVYDAWPHNFVEVTAHRDQGFSGPSGSGPGDSSLPLFFAPVIGHRSADLAVTSTAAMLPGVGFRIPPGSGETFDVLPITLDIETWQELVKGIGPDEWAYNEATGQISAGTSDGVPEASLYPDGSDKPSGNRGTVDVGNSNNSTSDLSRQIVYGLNESDLESLGFELRWDEPCVLNGDTGISAGIKDELDIIMGKPKLIPLFSHVEAPGNNATYTIVKFVGVRVLDVRLTGGAKRVIIQPAKFMDNRIIPGEGTVEYDSVLTTPRLIE